MSLIAPAQLMTSVVLFLLVLAPVGWALLRLGGQEARQEDLGLALALGYAVVPALILGEVALGGPWLVLPAVLVSAGSLWRSWVRLARPGGLPALLSLPLLLGALAAWVNARDVLALPDGLAFRLGFDVSDRAFYGMVARELLRSAPPHTENPLYAGMPFPYSYFPSLAGLLLHRYGGVPLLSVFLLHLPVVALIFSGIVADRLLRDMAVGSAAARTVTVLLVALGGDLSWALDTRNPTRLERTRHFLVFDSFPAESLFYNTWMFGVPVTLALLAFALRWARNGRRGDLLFSALLASALFETKVFALLPLLLGAAAAGALLRQRRLLLLALAMGMAAAPWAWLTSLFGPSREGSPLLLRPLVPVRALLQIAPDLGGLAKAASDPTHPWLGAAALGAATLLFLGGGFATRLCGLPRLVSLARSDRDGFHAMALAVVVLATGLGLLVVGNPLPTEGAQFLTLAQVVTWLYAGPALVEWASMPRLRLLALALLLSSPVTPLLYVAKKRFAEVLTPEDSWDRRYQLLTRDTVAACLWLEGKSAAPDRLMVPIFGEPGNLDGARTVYIAALSGRPIVAAFALFNLDLDLALARRRDVFAFYGAGDAATAEAILGRLHVRWVWEETAQPLRFSSRRLQRVLSSDQINLYEFR